MARHVTPDRAICGIATCFDVPSRDGNVWSADQLSSAWDLEMPVPLLIDHGPIVASHGFIDNVGEIYRFAYVTYPLDAMLILGEIDYARGFGDSILSDLRANLNQLYLPPTWGFSVGGWRDPDTGEVVLSEVSLTRRPAYSDARVLGVGPEAVELFAMLTEKRPVSR